MASRRGFATALAAGGLVVFAAIRGRLRRYEIIERSMEPRLRAGDFVLALERRNALQRGDIVIFPHPDIDEFDLVKSVVGLPGELVTLANGEVHIADRLLPERWVIGPTFPDGAWDLDADEVFVLGDNRPPSSADSRTLGPIDIEAIRWRVVARYWPPARIGRIRG
jgi:signal peptidase I